MEAETILPEMTTHGDKQGEKTERHTLQQLDRYLRRELRRHFLSERERIVADVLLEMTFGLGLRSVRIPKLETFTDLTGIDRGHVHGALKSLFEMHIVRVDRRREVWEYSVNPNPEGWKVKIRVPRETIRRGVEVVKAYNGMDGDGATPAPGGDSPNFKELEPAQFLLPGVADSATVAPHGDEFPEM